MQNGENHDLPAIVVGGPPHSGKTVLLHSLSHALRRMGVEHYVLRACPDGEGDWSQESDPVLASQIRIKGSFTEHFIAQTLRYLRHRQLPLLVDLGGRPSPEQEAILDECTGAILLVAERNGDVAGYRRDMHQWELMMNRHAVPVIARLRSVLRGATSLDEGSAPLQATFAGLERGRRVEGPVLDALARRLQELLRVPGIPLRTRHLRAAPVELALDLDRLAVTLGSPNRVWQPAQLPALLDYLPAGRPLALYGRLVSWVVAALGLLAQPAALWVFDPRAGWVEAPGIPVDAPGAEMASQPGWQTRVDRRNGSVVIYLDTSSQLLDERAPEALPLPPVAAGQGIILHGRVPSWLLAAATRHYEPACRWLATFYPPLGAAIVAFSRTPDRGPGEIVAL